MFLRLLLFLLCLSAAGHGPVAFARDEAPPPPGAIWILDLDDAVGPATSDYLVRGIADAGAADARLVVIRMDTPGGLDGAMRDIIEAILGSEVPVATFVAPGGARAASAGTYILYASHVAAMAPATTLGAATPINMGTPQMPSPPVPAPTPTDSGDETPEDEEEAAESTDSTTAPATAPAPATAMERKLINDAAAYIRGLADLYGRNAEWAELAVREAASLSAREALEANVIDLVAEDLDQLLEALEGREVSMGESTRELQLAGAPRHEAAPDWRTELLATITNPNLMLILGMLGFYGILLEFYNPGSLVPGTVGVICLLLAGYAMQLLPVNYAGLALLLVGLGLIVAEALSPSFGILGAGGLVAFVFGGIILFDSDLEAFQVGWPVLVVVGVLTGGLILVTTTLALRVRRQGVTTGIQTFIGHTAVALSDFDGQGTVRLEGEIWAARADGPVQKGDAVTITAVDGLTLSVAKEYK